MARLIGQIKDEVNALDFNKETAQSAIFGRPCMLYPDVVIGTPPRQSDAAGVKLILFYFGTFIFFSNIFQTFCC